VLQYYTALHHRVEYFISRDKQLKKDAISILPIYDPEEFLKGTAPLPTTNTMTPFRRPLLTTILEKQLQGKKLQAKDNGLHQ
jgi:hypothetical protein